MRRLFARFFRWLADLAAPIPPASPAPAVVIPEHADLAKLEAAHFKATRAVAWSGPSSDLWWYYQDGWGPRRWQGSPIVFPSQGGNYL